MLALGNGGKGAMIVYFGHLEFPTKLTAEEPFTVKSYGSLFVYNLFCGDKAN